MSGKNTLVALFKALPNDLKTEIRSHAVKEGDMLPSPLLNRFLFNRKNSNPIKFNKHSTKIKNIIYNPNNNFIYIHDIDGGISAWTRNYEFIRKIDIKSSYISPDGNILIVDEDTYFIVYVFTTNEPLQFPVKVFRIPIPAYTADDEGKKTIIFSHNSQIIYSGYDNYFHIWDIQGNLINTILRRFVTNVFFSYDDKLIYNVSKNNIEIYDTTGKLISDKYTYYWATKVTISPDNKTLLIAYSLIDYYGFRYLLFELWDIEDWYIKKSFEDKRFRINYEKELNVLAFSPDGKKFLSSSAGKTAKLWNLDGICLYTFNASKNGDITAATFSPDSNNIIFGYQDSTCQMLSIVTFTLLQNINYPQYELLQEIASVIYSKHYIEADEDDIKIFNDLDDYLQESFKLYIKEKKSDNLNNARKY